MFCILRLHESLGTRVEGYDLNVKYLKWAQVAHTLQVGGAGDNRSLGHGVIFLNVIPGCHDGIYFCSAIYSLL